MMPRISKAIVPLASVLALISCAHDANRRETQAPAPRVVEPMDDQYEAPPPRDTVPKVMQAKLAHAQAVLEGLALADCDQVQSNAMALKTISQGGDWLVQESAAYFELSSQFRSACDDLINHAHSRDLNAVARDYGSLVNSCVACHSYLRRERQTKDMPGRISMANDLMDKHQDKHRPLVMN